LRHVLPRLHAGRAICGAGPDHHRRRRYPAIPHEGPMSIREAGLLSKPRLLAVLTSRPFLTFAIVALVWIVASFVSRGFGAYGHLRYLVELAAVIGIVAAGQTFVVIAGGIDLSVAAIVTVAAVGLPLFAIDADPTGLTPILAVLAMTTAIG